MTPVRANDASASVLQALQRVNLAFAPADSTSSAATAFDVHGPRAAARVSGSGLRIISQDALAGIDIDFVGAAHDRGMNYGRHQQLEYDFRVAPGADPSVIRLQYGGTETVSIDANGDLRIGGRVVQRQPVVYQGEVSHRTAVHARYVKRATREVGIDVGSYDRELPLIIDPVMEYSFTSDWQATVHTLAVDAAGVAFVAGSTTSLMAAPGSTTWQSSPSGSTCWEFGEEIIYVTCTEGFLAKLDATGTYFEFATYIGGTSHDSVSAVAVGPDGSVYIAGGTSSQDFPVQPSMPSANPPGTFIAKFTAAGDTLVYSTLAVKRIAFCAETSTSSCIGYRLARTHRIGRLEGTMHNAQ